MPSVSELLIPLLSCVAVGVAAGAMRLFGIEEARVMSRFVFLIAMPVAVLDFMRATDPPGLAYAGLIAAYVLAMAATAGLALLLSRTVLGLSTQDAGAAVFATTCGNAVFLGLPIALSVGGWAPPFLILMLCEGLLVFALGTALMTWPAKGAPAPRGGVLGISLLAAGRASRNPVVIATLIGLALAVTGITLPREIGGFLDLFGGIAGPGGLFVLGLYVSILPRQRHHVGPKPLVTLLPLKLLFFPALTGALVWLFTEDPTFTSAALLFTGVPPAVSSIVQAAHYGRYEAGTAALVTSGTVIGLGTVTLLLGALLQG